MRRREGLEGGQWVVAGIQGDEPQGKSRQYHETVVSWAKDECSQHDRNKWLMVFINEHDG